MVCKNALRPISAPRITVRQDEGREAASRRPVQVRPGLRPRGATGMRRACARAAMWAHAMRFVWLRPGAACDSLRVCRTCSAPHDVRAWESSAGRGQRHRRCAVGCASQPSRRIRVASAGDPPTERPAPLRRAVVVPSMHGPARTVPARPDARTQASTHAARHARWGESATRRVQTRAANGRSADARLSAPRVPVCERTCRPCMCGAVHGVMEGQGDRGCDRAGSAHSQAISTCTAGATSVAFATASARDNGRRRV